jgi:iron complex transport system substrate-binding protein
MHKHSPSILAIAVATILAAAEPLAAQAGSVQPSAKRASVAYGAGFSIEYRMGYKILSVKRPWPGAAKEFTYVLYRRDTPKPAGIKADRFVETPVRRVVTFSTTYIPQIVAIGGADSIVGVDTADFVSEPVIRARIKSGATVETTRNWTPNVELLIALVPDAVFAYGMGNEWDSHSKLVEAGLPVIIDGEWNESDPLARAEWVKFIAAFYDKEAEAQAYFDKVASEYLRLKALAASAKERPTVLVNGPFQGSWSVSGGHSYMARFIADAGGAYLWADDTSTGALTLSVEAVYARALGAQIWLNPNLNAAKLADVAAIDPRFAALPVVAAGGVWNNNLRLNGSGGNDYFESAVLNPDKVLADLVKLLHPGLLSERPFTYYRNLER